MASRWARCSTDHAAFGRNRPNADNVIDCQSLERSLREKPVPTFSQRALAEFRAGRCAHARPARKRAFRVRA
ncbi:hypothetical protein EHO51_06290 [Methylocystis rosea]|uniref:Uncharacterized protein n=1 Tax=Methylocystis rosea TaxID=173366 RepID=A0A3G8M323_9HYPH|nr:hypothetical protein EHO51_06290 [Methylocystis rosea]